MQPFLTRYFVTPKEPGAIGCGDTLELIFQLEEIRKKLTAYAASILDSGS